MRFGLFLLAALPVCGFQEPSAIIRSETRVVLVDTVVTDKKGNYVHGLTAKDFKVFEDNKEQAITSITTLSETDNAAPRYIVFFFDNSTAGAAQGIAREAAVRFVEASASAQHLFAVAELKTSLSITQNFTPDAEKLKRAVSSAKVKGGSAPSMPDAAQAAQNNYSVTRALGALQNLTKGLTQLPGRKAIVFVSAGFPDSADTRAQIAASVAAANRSDVAIYPVSASSAELKPIEPSGGTPSSMPDTANVAAMRSALRNGLTLDDTASGSLQSLAPLATETGGFMISNAGDVLSSLHKIAQDQRETYLLGYTPSKEPQPGACHSLRVHLEKSGEVARFRTGYCESAALDALAGTATERDLEAKLESNAPPSIAGAAMQTPFFYTAANTARVHLSIEIPPATFEFTKEKGKFHSALNVLGVVTMPDGSVKSRFSDTVKFDFDDKKQADDFSATPFHYEKQFPMFSGQYGLKVIFNAGSGRFGRLSAPLIVDAWKPDMFMLSGIALGSSARAAEALDLLDDRVRLVANGFEVTPTGWNVIRQSAKAFVYAEAYEPAMALPGAKEADVPAVGVRMELVDPASGKVVKDFGLTRLRLPAMSGNPAVPIGLVLAAPEVSPGAYQLRVAALDAKGHQVSRAIDIRLEK